MRFPAPDEKTMTKLGSTRLLLSTESLLIAAPDNASCHSHAFHQMSTFGRQRKVTQTLSFRLSLIIMTVFFCPCRQSFPFSLQQPQSLQCRRWAQHSPMERKQRRKSIEKILLQAHTFLSGFERVSFNLALISICCFWDGLAARWTRGGILSKKTFKKGLYFAYKCKCPLQGYNK